MEARVEKDKMVGKAVRVAMEKTANWEGMAGTVGIVGTAALVA